MQNPITLKPKCSFWYPGSFHIVKWKKGGWVWSKDGMPKQSPTENLRKTVRYRQCTLDFKRGSYSAVTFQRILSFIQTKENKFIYHLIKIFSLCVSDLSCLTTWPSEPFLLNAGNILIINYLAITNFFTTIFVSFRIELHVYLRMTWYLQTLISPLILHAELSNILSPRSYLDPSFLKQDCTATPGASMLFSFKPSLFSGFQHLVFTILFKHLLTLLSFTQLSKNTF